MGLEDEMALLQDRHAREMEGQIRYVEEAQKYVKEAQERSDALQAQALAHSDATNAAYGSGGVPMGVPVQQQQQQQQHGQGP